MRRAELDSMKGYVKSLYERSYSSDSNIALIRHSHKIELNKEEIANMLPEEYNSRIFCHCFEGNRMGEAYEPFLPIIKQLMESQEILPEELIEAAGIYALHKPVFEGYFTTGKCNRFEEPLLSEVQFEKEKIIKEIANMLVRLCGKKDIFVILNRINYAGTSTLELLNYMIETPECEHIRIIAFDSENLKSHLQEEQIKDRLNTCCESKNSVFEWSVNSGEEEKITEKGFVFKGDEIEEYLVKSYNMFCMFAYDEMRYFLDIIYRKVQIENLGITKQQEVRLCMQLTTLAVLQGDFSHALLVAESLQELAEELPDWHIEYGYYYVMCYVHMHNGNNKEAEEAAVRCIKMAQDNGDAYLEFKGKIAKIKGKCSGFYNMMIAHEKYKIEEQLLEQCNTYHYYNHLARIYVYCFEKEAFQNKDIQKIENMKEQLPYFSKGIEIGEQLRNDQFLMEAYRTSIMLASYSGKRDIVNYFYEKNILVAKKSGNKFEEAMVYNGFGYNYCAEEEYEKAHHYFCLAMEIFHKLGLSDYIIETFYNMATNAIMAEDYEDATIYLEKTIQLLTLNRKNSLRVCNISKVIGLLALSSYYQGQVYSTKNHLEKDAQFLDYIIEFDKDNENNYLWDDDMFLYYLGRALLCHHSGNYEEAMELYKQVEFYMERSQGNYFFSFPHYCKAKQATLYKLGREEERMQLIDDYKRFCMENGYFNHLEAANSLLKGAIGNRITNPQILVCPIVDEIYEAERMRCIEKEARERRKEIQFFSLFQNLLDRREGTIEERIEDVLAALVSNYNLDGIISIQNSKDKRYVFCEKAKDLSKENIDLLMNFFEEKRRGFVVSKFNGNYRDYRKLFSAMFGEKVFSMVGVPIFENEKLTAIFLAYTKSRESWNVSTDRFVLNDYDLEIYTFLFRQILNGIKKWQAMEEIERMNKLLQKQAVTDELTGLFNRQGYYSIIRSIISNEEERKKKYAFVYMDLDHFKYYNDTFGHHVGDAILKSFADIFRRMAPQKANVLRLGGDEFAIILDYQDRTEIVKMAENILAEIEKADGFFDVVERYVSEDVTLEREHYAGCSIGIAYLDGVSSEEDFETARKNADSSLYHVKEHGRNSYQEWNG